MGSFLAEGEKECKVGFTTELQFTLKKDDYYFVSLEAVSAGDESQSRADFVEFTIDEQKNDLEKGIYIICVKLLKPANDILIKPKCIEIPCVKSYSPETKAALYANTPIIIAFNMPVEDVSITPDKSLFKYPNISIVYYGSDGKEKEMYEYFEVPELNNDKTVLTIKPIGAAIKDFIINNAKADAIDINFSFSETITVKNKEYDFPIKKDSNSSFTVRYNPYCEEIAPECKDFFVTNKAITIESAQDLTEQNKISIMDYSELQESNIDRTIVSSTFYIYGKYYDKDSGIRTIQVKEKYIYDSLNDKPINNSFEIDTSYNIYSPNVVFEKDEDGNTFFVLAYTLQDTLKETPGHGCFDISVTVKDGCDNSAEEQNFCVTNMDYGNLSRIRESGNSVVTTNEKLFYVYNTPISKAGNSTDHYDFEKYYSDIRTIRVKTNKSYPVYIKGKIRYFDSSNVEYYCEYINSQGKKTKEKFSSRDGMNERFVVLDIDKVADVPFTVIVEYKEGCGLGRKQFCFPSEPAIVTVNSNQISMAGNENKFSKLIQYTDNSYTIDSMDPSNPTTLEPDYKYYVGYYKSELGVMPSGEVLIGDIIGPFYDNQQSLDTPIKPENITYELSQSKEGFVDITFAFDENLWVDCKCDSLLAEVKKFGYKSEDDGGQVNLNYVQAGTWKFEQSKATIINNKICFSISVNQNWFYKEGDFYPLKVYLQGLKKAYSSGNQYNLRSSEQTIIEVSMDANQKRTFDNMKPSGVFKITRAETREVTFYFYDNGSGAKEGNLYYTGKTRRLIASGNIFSVPIHLFYLYYGNNLIEYELEDKAGNKTTGSYLFNPTTYITNHKCFEDFNSSTIIFSSETLESVYNDNAVLKIFEVNPQKTTGNWTLIKSITKNDINKNESSYSLKNSIQLTEGKFYRVYSDALSSYDDTIIRAVDNKGDSRSNYIFSNGSSSRSIVVSSGNDAVYVRVCAANEPYEICKKWTADQWTLMSQYYKTEIINIPDKPQVFDFADVSFSTSLGLTCYCVVAYFADGSSVASPVWEM